MIAAAFWRSKPWHLFRCKKQQTANDNLQAVTAEAKIMLCCLKSITAVQRESVAMALLVHGSGVTATCFGFGGLLDLWHSGSVAAALLEEKTHPFGLWLPKTASDNQLSAATIDTYVRC